MLDKIISLFCNVNVNGQHHLKDIMSTLKANIVQRGTALNSNSELAPASHNELQTPSCEQTYEFIETQDPMEICNKGYDKSDEGSGMVNQGDGGVLLFPTRKRAASSISMSDVPFHMSSGQILPAEGLASACLSAGAEQPSDTPLGPLGAKTTTAVEYLDAMHKDGEESDSEEKMTLFDNETGGVSLSGPPTSDKGKGKLAERCDKDGGVGLCGRSTYGKGKTIRTDSNSDDDDTPGGVLIRDFAIKNDHRAKKLEWFPKYDNKIANLLLELPEVPLTALMPVLTSEGILINEDAWTMVNMCGEVVHLPTVRRRRTVLRSDAPFVLVVQAE